jgi:hypothetical protein
MSLALVLLLAAADPNLDGLAEQVARLRGEIETLDAQLGEHKEARRSELRMFGAQKSTLELEIQREELRAKQLSERLARSKERAKTSVDRQEHLTEAILQAIHPLKQSLENSIPYLLSERSAAFEAIENELSSRTLAPSAALSRLWEWIDEELKLAKENGVHQQPLVIDGEELLVDVGRIGMAALYFRTTDGRVGSAKKANTTWTWVVETNLEAQNEIQHLIAILEQDAAKGFLVLPSMLTSEETR